ncbi:MAG: phosphatidylserine decarboxylase [Betaproteobacteria bacterium]|nr:phosphatidylserine decarboxylase [Betaproteobacteria bacterium]NBT75472.1 phosphatidylserine decarboxylase [Betaproteobacteria bacterium]NCA15778.1 phosphatidylserine decarboxylase [Betaproteobacteria bacterium]
MSRVDVPRYPHPLIAREGWPFVALTVGAAAVGSFLEWGYVGALLWLVALFVVQFFRDPARVPCADEEAIASPADGRIVYVGPARDPFSGLETVKISVFMNVFNVHSNRSPVAATVRRVLYTPGRFVNASFDKASIENERNALLLEDDKGRQLSCVQIAGLVARRILCYVREGDQLLRGSRYGFIRFGSRVDVYLPRGSQPLVAVGEVVLAHATALAHWPPSAQDGVHATP